MVILSNATPFDSIQTEGNNNRSFIIAKDITLGSLFNVSRTGGENIFATDLTPNILPCFVKFWIKIATIVDIDILLKRTKSGTTIEANLATITVANRPFQIEIPFTEVGETFNFRTTAVATYTVNYISVIELMKWI